MLRFVFFTFILITQALLHIETKVEAKRVKKKTRKIMWNDVSFFGNVIFQVHRWGFFQFEKMRRISVSRIKKNLKQTEITGSFLKNGEKRSSWYMSVSFSLSQVRYLCFAIFQMPSLILFSFELVHFLLFVNLSPAPFLLHLLLLWQYCTHFKSFILF